MNETDLYRLEIKENNMSKKQFVVISFIGATFILINASVFLIPVMILKNNTVIPPLMVYIICIIACYAKTTHYIFYHDDAYGSVYETYQVINASIYGLQGIFFSCLIFLLINAVIMPVVFIITILAGLRMIRKKKNI